MAKKARYYLNRPKPGKPALIILKFSYKSARVQVSTNEYVLPNHWDDESQRVASKWISANPDYLETNRVLDDVSNFVVRVYNEHRRDIRLSQLTPDVFRAKIKQKVTGQQADGLDGDAVLPYYQRYIFDRAGDGTLKKQTIKNERSAFNKFSAFADQFPGDLFFNQVNLRLFKQYRDWLWQSGTRTDSSVYKHINLFRRMLLFAAANGRQMGCDIKAISLKAQLNLSRQPMQSVALSETDIDVLLALDLSATPGKARVRDLFVLACYTGLRFNRWAEIKSTNVTTVDGTDMLQLFTEKGKKKKIVLPVHPAVRKICEAYQWQLPRIPKGQVVNRQLKAICKQAGFTQTLEFARNVQGQSVIERFERWQLISTHTARRSFATNAYLAGVPFDDIQAMTGHGSRRMLELYIKDDGTLRAKRLSQARWFGGNDNKNT